MDVKLLTRIGRMALYGVLGFAGLLVVLLAISLSPGDYRRLDNFAKASDKWDTETGFRDLCYAYSTGSAEALQARMLFVSTGDWVMFFRRLPNMPPHLRANPGSEEHYEHFTQGPLSAYLHLSEEQGIDFTLGMVENLARGGDLSDQRIAGFLQSFTLRVPVKVNAAGLQSVRDLLGDVDATRSFMVREKPAPLLRPLIAQLAASRGIPPEPAKMTYAQQLEVLEALDGYVKEADYELWRTKQVNDLLAGIWGQSYAATYKGFMRILLPLRDLALALTGAGLVALFAWRRFLRRNRAAPVAVTARSPQ